MAKISVYLNPRASRGESLYSEEELRKFFFRHELAIKTPGDLSELEEKLKEDVSNKVDYVFSVGGDGTVNTISQNLIGSDVKLMILPAGTANDFAKEMGISGGIKKISQIFNAETTKKIDGININGRYMFTNGGIGMASEVARTVDRMRKESPLFKKMMTTIGKENYSLVYAQKMLLRAFETRKVFIESKDSPLLDPRVSSPLVLINNQEYIGGKFRVAPFTKNDDGKFNVTIFLHDNRMDLLKATLQMMMGRYPENDKNLVSFETTELVINSLDQKPLQFFGDGEIFPDSQILNITMQPKALEVCSYHGEALLCSSHSLKEIELIQ